MSQYTFELSKPKGGWMDITIRDEQITIKFPASYLWPYLYAIEYIRNAIDKRKKVFDD